MFLCIAIIATTAVYVMRNNMDYFSRERVMMKLLTAMMTMNIFNQKILNPPNEEQQSLEENSDENKEVPNEEPKEGEKKI